MRFAAIPGAARGVATWLSLVHQEKTMRSVRYFVVVGIVSACLPALAQDDAQKKDMDMLQGTWRLVAVEVDGKQATRAGQKQEPIMKVEANKFTSTLDDKHEFKGTFTVDPSKKPKQVDFKVLEGEHEGKTLLGIYEVTGDKLRAAYGDPGQPRPTEFTSKAGASLYLYERAKVKR